MTMMCLLRVRKSDDWVVATSKALLCVVSIETSPTSSWRIGSAVVVGTVLGFLFGFVRFVVTWGLFVVAVGVVAEGLGFKVVGFDGRGLSPEDGLVVLGRTLGLFVVTGLLVVTCDGLLVVDGLLVGFFVVLPATVVIGLFVTDVVVVVVDVVDPLARL